MSIKPYFFYLNDPYDSGCALVFETTARRAKTRGWREWVGSSDGHYTDARAVRADDAYWLFARESGPHLIDSYDGPEETWDEALERAREMLS